ncbi:MAG: hypothetical protein M3169_06370 [Candidatus Eremiobacteraeota bacterium]|nr:hypothetical protein [Candidatus Eremiobacteraeota bacterium]
MYIGLSYCVPSRFDSAPNPIDVQPRIGGSNEYQAHVITQLASTGHQLKGLAPGESRFDCEIARVSKRRGDALQRDAARCKRSSGGRSAPNRQCNLIGIDTIAHNNRRQQLD